jgi:pyruvate dehydrogenase (quinone)
VASRAAASNLKNPDFGKVAEAMAYGDAASGKQANLKRRSAPGARPGPALLDVKVNPMQPVMPPSPFLSPKAVVGMAVYSARAVLRGKGRDVWEMVTENLP